MGELTLEEVKKMKAELSRIILENVQKFEQATDLEVSSIDMKKINLITKECPQTSWIRIRCNL